MMTIYQVIAEEPRTITRQSDTRFGTFTQERSVTLPAGRVVATWPYESMAERTADNLRRKHGERFSVRIKPESGALKNQLNRIGEQ